MEEYLPAEMLSEGLQEGAFTVSGSVKVISEESLVLAAFIDRSAAARIDEAGKILALADDICKGLSRSLASIVLV